MIVRTFGIFAFLSFLRTFNAFAVNPQFSKCGFYEVTGLLTCEKTKCTLTAYPRSKSQTKITFQQVSPFVARLDKTTIRAEIQITQNRDEPLNGIFSDHEVPYRSKPNSTVSAVHLIRDEKCNP